MMTEQKSAHAKMLFQSWALGLNRIFCFEQYLSRSDRTSLDATAADRGLDAGLVSRLQHSSAGDGALGLQNKVPY